MHQENTVQINANLKISGATLQKFVNTAKSIAGADNRGRYKIDTADLLSAMISQFLEEGGFDTYVEAHSNYARLLDVAKQP